MSSPNPICPCCKALPKNPKASYCNPCNRKKQAARYAKSREGKTKGVGWRKFHVSAKGAI